MDTNFVGEYMHAQAAIPASAASPGVIGTMAYSTDYIYICVATNVWRRVPVEIF
jgi:hypothetical protein